MKTNNQKVVKILSAAIVALIFVLGIVLVFQFIKIANLKEKQQLLQTELNRYEQQILNYSSENEYLNSPQFFEDYAREVLGWGKVGETRFK
jgi:cell division protein FtsB